MATYPWGALKHTAKRKVWLGENGLTRSFSEYQNQAIESGMSKAEAEEWASDKINEDFQIVQMEDKSNPRTNAHAPVREDWYWAFEHYGDVHGYEDASKNEVKREDAPSPFAWSLLIGAWANDTNWKSLQDKVAKDLFGGDVSDDDDRAFIATGMPSALRERFSGIPGEAKRLFSGKLPEVFGRTEGS